MKCFFHESLDAVSNCQNCGKGLCKECSSKHIPCLCEDCAVLLNLSLEKEKAQKKKDALIDTNKDFLICIIKGLFCSIVLTLIFNAIGSFDSVPISMSIMFFFVPFGWAMITYLEQWLPSILMGGLVFLIYIAFKLAFSMILGIPFFAYQVIRYIFKLVNTARIK